MNMTDGPGRTYKYLKDPTMADWPFGFGLSYTTFALSDGAVAAPLDVGGSAAAHNSADRPTLTTARVTVRNTGSVAGDEVVFLFKNSSSAAARSARPQGGSPAAAGAGAGSAPIAPIKELIGFRRVHLAPGASTTVVFNVTATLMSSVDAFGTRAVLKGVHELIFSRGHGADIVVPLQLQVEAHSDNHGESRGGEAGSGSDGATGSDRLGLSSLEGIFGLTRTHLGL